jgi:hypothetical protein
MTPPGASPVNAARTALQAVLDFAAPPVERLADLEGAVLEVHPRRVAARVGVVLRDAVDPGRRLAARSRDVTVDRHRALDDHFFLLDVARAPAIELLPLLRREEQTAKFVGGHRKRRREARADGEREQRSGSEASRMPA